MVDKLVIVLVIILGALAIAQIMRVSELAQKLSKYKPEETPPSENNFNAISMIVFMVLLHAFLIYLIVDYGFIDLGPAASVGGQQIDFIYSIQWVLVLLVYFSCVTLTFWFSYKYRKKPGVKAIFYPYNNKLEMIWTVVPAAGLSVMVILGLKTWNDITSPATEDYENVEVFAYQFAWTARYSGMNNELGKFDYKLTTPENPYAIVTRDNIERSLELMKVGEPGSEGIEMLEAKLNDNSSVISKSERKKLMTELGRKERMARLLEAMSVTYNDSLDELALDDVIVEDSLVLLKGQKYNFSFRSKDVIHSAYFPHFRAQMNTVPGLTTYFKIQPVYTSDEMKDILDNPEFEYAILCNKVCGTAHYRMKMSVKVLGPKEYLEWQKTKSTIDGTPWIEGNESQLLEYYEAIASRIDN